MMWAQTPAHDTAQRHIECNNNLVALAGVTQLVEASR